MQAADAPRAAERQRQDGQAEERDGQEDAGHHGDDDEGQPDAGQGRTQTGRRPARTSPLGERLVQDGPCHGLAARSACSSVTASDSSRPADPHPDPAVLGLAPASCVPPGEQTRSQPERGGAVGDHEHDPDRGRHCVDWRHDGRHRVGEDELGGEPGDALRASEWSRTGAGRCTPAKAAMAPAVWRMTAPRPSPSSAKRARKAPDRATARSTPGWPREADGAPPREDGLAHRRTRRS